MRRCLYPLIFVCLLLFVAAPSAQTRAAIAGIVRDDARAVLPGATVTLTSPELLGGARTVVTNERGEYRFGELPPGTFELRASLAGFQPAGRTGLRVSYGTTLTIDFSLTVGVTETVTVAGADTPAVDVTTAQSTARVDRDLLMNLPTFSNQRESNTIFELSPGSTYTAAFGSTSNHVMFDGSPILLNAITLSSNWLEEVNVVSLGATAEHGEFGGVAANLIVRSGSNDLRGLFEYRTTRPEWLSTNTSGLPDSVRARFSQNRIVERWDSSAQAGGPIVRDRLFFFGGVQYFYDETQIAGAPAAGTNVWPRSVGKLSGAIADGVTAEGTYSYSKSTNKSWAPNTALDAGGQTEQPGHLWSTRVTAAPASNTLWEFRTTGAQWMQDVGPQAPNTKLAPPPRRDTVTGISSGNTSQFRVLDATRLTAAATLLRYFDRAGQHAVKAGLEYDHQSFSTESGFPGGMSFVDRNGVPDQVSIWAGDVEEGIGRRATVFLMDEWQVSSRVTLQPGVRISRYRGATPSTGTVFATETISPRLGFAWDVGPDHKTVVRGQWGRYHAALDTATWSFVDTRRTPRVTARVLADGTFQEINRVTPAGNSAVDPDIQHAYMDQAFAGIERELAGDLSLKVQYVHKDFRNNWAFIDTRSIFSPVEQRDPGRDNIAGTADDGEIMTVYALLNPGQAYFVQTNPDGADRQYDALQLIAQKRFSRNWQMLASYTRSSSRGAINNTNLSQAVGTGGIFADPNSAINAGGRSGLDFPNQASFRATYHAPWLGGFNVSASHIYASGVAWSRTATFRLPQGNVTVRVAPRGSEPAAATNQTDVRVEKVFTLGRRWRSISAYVDVFNLFNNGFPPQTRYNEASGATFGQPLNWVEGRAFKAAARVTF